MFQKSQTKENINMPLIIIAAFIIFYVLYIGASFIIPFIISLLFSFAIIGTSQFYQKFNIPVFVAYVLSLSTYTLIFWMIWELINANIQDVIAKLPDYQEKIMLIVESFFKTTHIPAPQWLSEVLARFDMAEVFSVVAWSITSIFSSAWIIFFYTLFILLEYKHVWTKLSLMITDPERKIAIMDTISKIKGDTKAYFIIKTIVSLITAISSFVVMRIFNLDFAIFWAFVIFVLNFIPSVGSIIALIFPISISLIQYNTLYPFIFITASLIGIQVLMWNIIEPRFMWNRLNLSPLVIIIALSFWWALWWVVGMILSVPIMVIINIVLAKIPETRSFAILLSEKWELKMDTDTDIIKTRQQFIQNIQEKITQFWQK